MSGRLEHLQERGDTGVELCHVSLGVVGLHAEVRLALRGHETLDGLGLDVVREAGGEGHLDDAVYVELVHQLLEEREAVRVRGHKLHLTLWSEKIKL